jgi:hypothetical protein
LKTKLRCGVEKVTISPLGDHGLLSELVAVLVESVEVFVSEGFSAVLFVLDRSPEPLEFFLA